MPHGALRVRGRSILRRLSFQDQWRFDVPTIKSCTRRVFSLPARTLIGPLLEISARNLPQRTCSAGAVQLEPMVHFHMLLRLRCCKEVWSGARHVLAVIVRFGKYYGTIQQTRGCHEDPCALPAHRLWGVRDTHQALPGSHMVRGLPHQGLTDDGWRMTDVSFQSGGRIGSAVMSAGTTRGFGEGGG